MLFPFKADDGKFHFLYKTTNTLNDKIYIGVHSTKKLNDKYLGSGVAINNAFKKYGKKYFKREILSFFVSAKEAYAAEKYIVTEEFISRKDVYNCVPGGLGGSLHKGKMTVKRGDETKQIDLDEKESYISEGWYSVCKDMITIRIGDTLYKHMKREEAIGLPGATKGFSLVKDINGNNILVKSEEAKELGLSGHTKGMKWIHKGDVHKTVHPEYIQSYIEEGWILGPKPGSITIKVFDKEGVEHYFLSGEWETMDKTNFHGVNKGRKRFVKPNTSEGIWSYDDCPEGFVPRNQCTKFDLSIGKIYILKGTTEHMEYKCKGVKNITAP